MPKENKATKAICEQRVNELVPLVSFLSRREILSYVRKNLKWDVSVKQIDNYRVKAQECILEALKEKRSTAAQDAVNNLSTLYKKALEMDDIKAALLVLDRVHKLLGLDKAQDNEIQIVDFDYVIIDDERNQIEERKGEEDEEYR